MKNYRTRLVEILWRNDFHTDGGWDDMWEYKSYEIARINDRELEVKSPKSYYHECGWIKSEQWTETFRYDHPHDLVRLKIHLKALKRQIDAAEDAQDRYRLEKVKIEHQKEIIEAQEGWEV